MSAVQPSERFQYDFSPELTAAYLLADRWWLEGRLRDLGRQFVKGTIDSDSFKLSAAAYLEKGHVQAAMLGTAMAGGHANSRLSHELGAKVAKEQRRFMFDFAGDIAEGRYKAKSRGGKGARARNARFDLYSRRMVGTANQAWLAEIQKQNLNVLWRFGTTKEHCETCKMEAGMGWRKARDLTRVPGDGSTACIIFCGCILETEDDRKSFTLGDFQYTPPGSLNIETLSLSGLIPAATLALLKKERERQKEKNARPKA